MRKADDRRQRSEDRRQKADDRRQMTEVRRRKRKAQGVRLKAQGTRQRKRPDYRWQIIAVGSGNYLKSKVGVQKADDRGQMTEDRDQMTEDRSQKADDRKLVSGGRCQLAEYRLSNLIKMLILLCISSDNSQPARSISQKSKNILTNLHGNQSNVIMT